MICHNCYKFFNSKRSFLDFFATKAVYICETCRNNFPLKLNLTRLPLENYELVVVSFLEKHYKFNLTAYIEEISQMFNFFRLKHTDFFIIYLDYFNITDLNLEIISFIADCEKNPIFILCGNIRK